MANKGKVENNEKRKRLAAKHAARRQRLKAVAEDTNNSPEERMQARLALAQLPRNSSHTRVKNRCEVTGRPRSYHRKFKMSRIALRDLANKGQIPGVKKSSW